MNNLDQIKKKNGKLLRKLRTEMGYSSYESFAFEHNLSRIQYWRMEAGKTNYSIKTLIKVLDIHKINYITEYPELLRKIK